MWHLHAISLRLCARTARLFRKMGALSSISRGRARIRWWLRSCLRHGGGTGGAQVSIRPGCSNGSCSWQRHIKHIWQLPRTKTSGAGWHPARVGAHAATGRVSAAGDKGEKLGHVSTLACSRPHVAIRYLPAGHPMEARHIAPCLFKTLPEGLFCVKTTISRFFIVQYLTDSPLW